MLLARFLMIPMSPENAAFAANGLSVLSSSFTILFLFWSITHLAKRLLGEEEPAGGSAVAVLGAGAIGALAYTFSDSFWFSAVEEGVRLVELVHGPRVLGDSEMGERGGRARFGQVDHFDCLFDGVVHWCALAQPVGHSSHCLGVFLPQPRVFVEGTRFDGSVFIVLLGFVQEALIKGAVQLAGSFELLFVNDLGMPFNTGALVYLALLVGGIAALLWVSHKKGWWAVNTLTLGMAMVLLGYSSFATIMIRSAANPPMDENDPQNLFALLSYLSREQYGDRPLATRQFWDTPTVLDKPYLDGKPSWVKVTA